MAVIEDRRAFMEMAWRPSYENIISANIYIYIYFNIFETQNNGKLRFLRATDRFEIGLRSGPTRKYRFAQ